MKRFIFTAGILLAMSCSVYSQDHIFVSQFPLGFQNENFVKIFGKQIQKKAFNQGVYRYYLGERQYYWGKTYVTADATKLKKYDNYVITSISIKFYELDKYYACDVFKIIIESLSSMFGEPRVEGTLKPAYIWDTEDVLIRKEDNCIIFYAKEKYLESLQMEALRQSVESIFGSR
ncbi:MAG: hypothetical protein JW728_02260 [Candidatus Aureabacteria bacterium]|nr:hypothetical protein [Candidatus Auribacterota bacterium]